MHTTREIAQINDLHEKWQEYEHDSWKLLSFSQNEARFGWLVNGQYQKYVTVTRAEIDFILGVPPDVLDQF